MVMAMVEDHISRYLDKLREEEGLRDVDPTALRLLSNAAEELRKRADKINPPEIRCGHHRQFDLSGVPMPCATPKCSKGFNGREFAVREEETDTIIRYVRSTQRRDVYHCRWVLL